MKCGYLMFRAPFQYHLSYMKSKLCGHYHTDFYDYWPIGHNNTVAVKKGNSSAAGPVE